jgi:TatD DNase family protein
MEEKGLDVTDILSQCFKKGMSSALDVAVNEENFDRRLTYKKLFPHLFFAAGVHPTEIKEIEKQITIIDKQLENQNIIAVGETGLDFHWDTVPGEVQKEMFCRHIELSNKHKKPLIIHNRLADKEILEILTDEQANYGGIIHCFSSGYDYAQKFIDMGFYISFAGNITYKKSENIREAAARISFEKILVETDAPYLSPQKMRGKLNHPGNISYTIDCIADLFNKGADETAQQLNDNFKRLFHLEF